MQQLRNFASPEHQRASAVAKEHAGGAIRPVTVFRHDLAGNHDGHVLIQRVHERCRRHERIDKSCAARGDIHRRADRNLQRLLHAPRQRRRQFVPCDGARDDYADIFRRFAGHRKRVFRGRNREVCRRLFHRDMAGANARALADPLVAGLYKLSQFVIGHYLVGYAFADARNRNRCQHLVSPLF
ncbi:hypothetical protein SDC9_158252 [bioreactor metagenome]|uniref:Uncharacterized protein n=1 Tax=bioreactor metagenome TaxID=1076179 RepID=A0A645FEN1_9ZZZZ